MRVLVTGGSMGIGRAVAERLAADGARVALVARGRESLEATLAALPGDGHTAHAFDVGDPHAWAQAADAVADLTGVVTAAGVLAPVGVIGTYDPAEFWRTMAINVLGTQLAIHHALPALRRSGGAVVTFSGGGATGPLERYDAYATSKAATVRLTENVAVALRDEGIRVNAVAPGFVATRMHETTLAAGARAGSDYLAKTERQLAEGGVPPTQAAALVAFLLSPAAEGITGKLLSAQWDPWQDPDFVARLRTEGDLATLRRVDDMFVRSVPPEERP